jgi:hypothetical protein
MPQAGRPPPEAIAGPEPHRESRMAPIMSESVGLEMDAVYATHPVKTSVTERGGVAQKVTITVSY